MQVQCLLLNKNVHKSKMIIIRLDMEIIMCYIAIVKNRTQKGLIYDKTIRH